MSLHARPEHITVEADPMFSSWSRLLPRLWYLDQRQATKVDAETLYGSSLYAAFFGRSAVEDVDPPADESMFATVNYWRSVTEGVDMGVEAASRTVDYARSVADTTMNPSDAASLHKAGSGVVQPPIHEAIPGDA